jgi:hypothetical protein
VSRAADNLRLSQMQVPFPGEHKQPYWHLPAQQTFSFAIFPDSTKRIFPDSGVPYH